MLSRLVVLRDVWGIWSRRPSRRLASCGPRMMRRHPTATVERRPLGMQEPCEWRCVCRSGWFEILCVCAFQCVSHCVLAFMYCRLVEQHLFRQETSWLESITWCSRRHRVGLGGIRFIPLLLRRHLPFLLYHIITIEETWLRPSSRDIEEDHRPHLLGIIHM
jgi:hypothetical protein